MGGFQLPVHDHFFLLMYPVNISFAYSFALNTTYENDFNTISALRCFTSTVGTYIPTVCQQSAHCDLPNLPASPLIFMLSLSFFILPPFFSLDLGVFSFGLPPSSLLSTSFDVCVSDAWCGQMTAGRCHTLLSPVTEESGEEGTNSEVSSPPACRSPSPGANADTPANQVLQSRPPSCLVSLVLPSSLHILHLRACPAPSSPP